jgi:hypothetical protein
VKPKKDAHIIHFYVKNKKISFYVKTYYIEPVYSSLISWSTNKLYPPAIEFADQIISIIIYNYTNPYLKERRNFYIKKYRNILMYSKTPIIFNNHKIICIIKRL